MFVFIGGVQSRTVVFDREAGVCPSCCRSKLEKKRVDRTLSLFFIPLFPIKKGQPFLSCRACGAVFDEGGSRTK